MYNTDRKNYGELNSRTTNDNRDRVLSAGIGYWNSSEGIVRKDALEIFKN